MHRPFINDTEECVVVCDDTVVMVVGVLWVCLYGISLSQTSLVWNI